MSDLTAVITNAVTQATGGAENTSAGTDEADGAADQSLAPADEGGEHPESSTEGGRDSSPSEPAPAPPPESEDLFAKEHGLDAPKPGQRENRIPYSRVKKIVGNAERKLAEAILGTAPPEDKPILDVVKAHVEQIPTLTTRVQELEGELEGMYTVGNIMERNPEQFVQLLPLVNPRYADLLGKAASPAPEPETPKDMPQPDYDLGNGQKTYSPEGLAKLLAWNAAQVRQQVIGEIDQRFKPIIEEHEGQQVKAVARGRAQDQIARAMKWPGFEANHEAILAKLQADKRGQLSLHDAYAIVLDEAHQKELATLRVSRETQRQEILNEIKKRPTETSVAPLTQTDARAAAKPKTMHEIINEAVRNSGLK